MLTTSDTDMPEGGGAAEPRRCGDCGTEVADPRFKFCTSCGSVLATAGPGRDLVPVDKPAAEDDEAEWGWWRRHRRWVLITAAAILVVPTALYLGWQWTGLRTADGPVRTFFAALEDRDGPAAAAALGEEATVSTGGMDLFSAEQVADSPLFAPGALDTGYTPPTLVDVTVDYFMDVDTVEQRPDKSLSEATATFTIGEDDRVWELDFLMVRDESGWDRQWSIDFIRFGTAGSVVDATVRVAGVETAEAPLAPPGAYDVSVTDQVLWEDASGTVIVGGEEYTRYETPEETESTGAPDDGAVNLAEGQDAPGGSHGVVVERDLELRLRPDVLPAVEQAIREQVLACAEPHQLVWEACPFQLVGDSPIAHHIRSVLDRGSEWEVTTWPEINLVTTRGYVQVQVTTPGHAEGTAIGNEDGSPGMVLLNDDYEAEIVPYGVVHVDDGGNITYTYTP